MCALELLSMNTDKGASHSGRASTPSPKKKVSTCGWTGRRPGQRRRRSQRRDHPELQSRQATGYPGSQGAGRGVCPVGGVEGAAAPSPAASVRRAAPHQRARGPCNHVVDAEASEAGRPEQSDRGARVFVGAFPKGRSSSRKLNAVIRRVGARPLEVRAWRSGVPRCLRRPRLSSSGAARWRSTVTCGTGPSVNQRRSWGGRTS